MNSHRFISTVVTTLVLLAWRPDRSIATLCHDTLYAEECNTWLSGSGIIDVEPICRNGTIQWHKCQNQNLTIRMTTYEAFRMCFRLDKIPYNIIDTTNYRNVPKTPPKKGSPCCILSRPVNNRQEMLQLRLEPGSPGSKFLVNIPFTVNKVSLPKISYG